MSLPLRVLIVEDSTTDTLLIERALKHGDYELVFKRVDTTEAMRAALDEEVWDVVVADYFIPQFSGLAALELLKEKCLDLPFIIVSGAVGEETAVEAMRVGAHDFIMKNNLSRLVPAIERELREANARREQRHTQEALRESEEQFRIIFDRSLDAIMIVESASERILRVNPAVRRILGYEPDHLAGKPFSSLFPENAESAAGRLADALRTHEATFDSNEFLRGDGSICQMDMTTADIAWGEDKACLVTLRDVTERKRLEQQLYQSQKLEDMGRLAGGMAHDFNNLLTAIIGYSNLLLMRLPEDDSLRQSAEEIKKAGDRAAALTRQLLAFSRKQLLQLKIMDPGESIATQADALRRLIGSDIELVTVLDSDLGYIKADPAQIEEVIMGLAANARDAMPEGGKLIIEAANVYLNEESARSETGIQPGPYVMLSITDTGRGMDEKTLFRLFEPFFTTKQKGKGTGMMLSTIYGIIKQSGGHIKVQSEMNAGSVFKIYLPRVEGEKKAMKSGALREAVLHGSETILLAEDEEIVRNLARDIIKAGGYRVLEAADGIEALEICERFNETIHLMLTDVVMPRLNGFKLAERATGLRPAMKVLYMSGYMGNDRFDSEALEAGTAFLQKPFTASDLMQKLREVLDGQREGYKLIRA